ncbi:hypothetical protein SCUCBS95973_005718 [Sporothrix curviconia]|uniref:Uncharacterized protein n=1 Tax=Sporothrix curviconia TaxID=1260050 RepID=A0ABP0BZK3_9PEZI
MAKSISPPPTQHAIRPGIVFQVVACTIMLLAVLLPMQSTSSAVALARRTASYTSSASGVSSAICSIVLHTTGKTRELGYLSVPLGLPLGAATAAWLLAHELPLSARI